MDNTNANTNIKIIALTTLLIINAFLLTATIKTYVLSGNYLTFSSDGLFTIFIQLGTLLILNAFVLATQSGWKVYTLVPISILIGQLPQLIDASISFLLIYALLIYLFLIGQIIVSQRLKSKLILFDARFILEPTTKGLILTFSILAGAIVLIYGESQKIDVGNKVGEIADKYIGTQTTSNVNLGGYNVNNIEFLQNITEQKNPTKSLVAQQVNKILEPYKNYIGPIFSALAFGTVQFIGFLVYMIHVLVINPIFMIAKKSNFIKVTKKPVEQEMLSF